MNKQCHCISAFYVTEKLYAQMTIENAECSERANFLLCELTRQILTVFFSRLCRRVNGHRSCVKIVRFALFISHKRIAQQRIEYIKCIIATVVCKCIIRIC